MFHSSLRLRVESITQGRLIVSCDFGRNRVIARVRAKFGRLYCVAVAVELPVSQYTGMFDTERQPSGSQCRDPGYIEVKPFVDLRSYVVSDWISPTLGLMNWVP